MFIAHHLIIAPAQFTARWLHNRRYSAKWSCGVRAPSLQDFADRLFARLQKANERLETRLCMMSVISRAVGVHKLQLLNFYPFLQKYIQPHQRDVPQILAFLVQVAPPPPPLLNTLNPLPSCFPSHAVWLLS